MTTARDAVHHIAAGYGLTIAMLRAPSKQRMLARCRAECVACLRDRYTWSFGQIGLYLQRDKASVISAYNVHKSGGIKSHREDDLIKGLRSQLQRLAGVDVYQRFLDLNMKPSATVFLGILVEHYGQLRTMEQLCEAYETAWEYLGVPRDAVAVRDGDPDDTALLLKALAWVVRRRFERLGLPQPIARGIPPWGYSLTEAAARYLADTYGRPVVLLPAGALEPVLEAAALLRA